MGIKKEFQLSLKNWLKRRFSQWSVGALESTPVKAWSLDYPSLERDACFVAAGRVVQGWVLFNEAVFAGSAECAAVLSSARVVASWDAFYELSHPLELARPDVIERVLKDEPSQHSQRHCGFRFSIPHRVKNFKLWLAIENQRWLLKDIAIIDDGNTSTSSVLKVLEGRDGWLFLDNDTNGSVDQYAGRLLLTAEGISAWQYYLREVERQANLQQAKYAVLVAPSKESVMGPHYHPYSEGERGPICQLLELSVPFPFVYPLPDLLAMGDDAFIQTDTHWTQQGAMVAVKTLAEKLGLDSKVVSHLFANDCYHKRVVIGDLGNKFEPPRQCEVPILTSFSYLKCLYYDNGLPNFGRLLVLVNDNALVKETCLIFGSSSSYSMFHYLCRLFHRVVFVHSAGSLDQALISAVKPAYLVIQTNARFVVQVPSLELSLKKMIIDKRARLSEEELEMVAKRQICPPVEDVLLDELSLTPWLI